MNKLPIIEQFEQAATDQERALILLQAPPILPLKYRESFVSACRRADFTAGPEFIAALSVFVNSVRDPSGLPTAEALMALGAAGGELRLIAGACETIEVIQPDHSITEL